MEKETVYVGNLNFKTKHDDLKTYFDDCGVIVSIRIAFRDERSRGFGYVCFKTEEGAAKALEKDGNEFMERNCKVAMAKV